MCVVCVCVCVLCVHYTAAVDLVSLDFDFTTCLSYKRPADILIEN